MKKFNLTWTPPANNGGAEITGHDVGYTPSGGSETIEATGSTAASHIITGLTDGTEYSVRVRAENAVGKGAWSSAVTQLAALPPEQVTGVSASGGDTTLDLSWTAPASDAAITDYSVEYTPSGGSATTVLVGSAATSYQLTSLTNDTEYSVRVAAVSAAGTGAYSAAVTGTPSAFSPADITGLQLWLDASDSSTLYDATTGGSLVAADSAVARWEDKSGNERHATQGTAANRPARKTAIQGGQDVLRFDGTNDQLVIPSSTTMFNFLHNATGGTTFAVYKVADTQGACYVFANNTNPSTGSAANQTGVYLRHDTSDQATPDRLVVLSNASSGGFRLIRGGSANSAPSGVFAVVSLLADMNQGTVANRHKAFYNGTDVTGSDNFGLGESVALQTGNASNDMTIMSNVNGVDVSEGDICELIMYSGVLSDTDRQAVENYLMAKWGIA